VGLDTIGLHGAGFEKLATAGQAVVAGQPIVRFDRGVIARAGLPTVSPVVSSGAGRIVQRATGRVRAGQDIVFIVEI
jgi:phosphotransferase system IIA component